MSTQVRNISEMATNVGPIDYIASVDINELLPDGSLERLGGASEEIEIFCILNHQSQKNLTVIFLVQICAMFRTQIF